MKKRLFVLLLLCSACGSRPVFEEYREMPKEKWNRYHIVEFTTSIPDSGLYRVQLCLRHTTDYEMGNLWCFISTRSSMKNGLKDTLEMKIADADGSWSGKGGRMKTVEQDISPGPVVLPRGEVVFRIGQGMRMENLKGVRNVGLRISKVKDNTKTNEKQTGKICGIGGISECVPAQTCGTVQDRLPSEREMETGSIPQ